MIRTVVKYLQNGSIKRGGGEFMNLMAPDIKIVYRTCGTIKAATLLRYEF